MGNKYGEFDVIKEPELPRRFRLWKHQWIGLPLLLAIPILALTGLFGESHERAVAEAGQIELSVDYPKRLRYGQDEKLRIKVENRSSQPLDAVQVMVDETYMGKFAEISITLDSIGPGETRTVDVDFRGNGYGSSQGTIKAVRAGQELAAVDVSSFIFP